VKGTLAQWEKTNRMSGFLQH